VRSQMTQRALQVRLEFSLQANLSVHLSVVLEVVKVGQHCLSLGERAALEEFADR
jgi:hypothetical protein